ncbi:YbjN domain-containing protein [Schaalia sp. lx-260]|uniref:YbjN domain-containing protein n=1 Tax=Schaalia sp. lx-260 TaxID=2899082 RepID=UPI001E56ECA1|nr:YbjN domain-containing protein [Schaalia sp. lx-260]MCD4549492.1 YbjN domain-containing protein [Schaalia sp. lx-260]
MGFFSRLLGHDHEDDPDLSSAHDATVPATQAPTSELLPTPTLEPISQERLITLFDKEEWHYEIDADGDLGGRWDNGIFYFLFAGNEKEILHISSRMREEIPEECADDFKVFIEDWNRDKIWPKAYYVYTDGGQLHLHAEVNVDYEQGASDSQIMQHIHCALGTTLSLYSATMERFNIPSLDAEENDK